MDKRENKTNNQSPTVELNYGPHSTPFYQSQQIQPNNQPPPIHSAFLKKSTSTNLLTYQPQPVQTMTLMWSNFQNMNETFIKRMKNLNDSFNQRMESIMTINAQLVRKQNADLIQVFAERNSLNNVENLMSNNTQSIRELHNSLNTLNTVISHNTESILEPYEIFSDKEDNKRNYNTVEEIENVFFN
ncbi:unnamed protein product [Brachionus calyciflorus]|uniref:Uncharacterized protein n=1 Tax=Brachionus calyciflorus TaxID=104777 RepID=A0A814A369_9BILA|nr:unnamed protein product [Brachionus calyciflorus]